MAAREGALERQLRQLHTWDTQLAAKQRQIREYTELVGRCCMCIICVETLVCELLCACQLAAKQRQIGEYTELVGVGVGVCVMQQHRLGIVCCVCNSAANVRWSLSLRCVYASTLMGLCRARRSSWRV